jgi:hypothetical protein
MKKLFFALMLPFFWNLHGNVPPDAGKSNCIEAKEPFLQHWHEFGGDATQFSLWSPDLSEEELKARFDQIHQQRWSVYFVNPEDCQKPNGVGRYKKNFEPHENWAQWGSRYSYPGTFAYNAATGSYNASIIFLNGKFFIAMEAPTEHNLASFCQVLSRYQITDLVRLTPARYGDKENSFPYWEGRLNIHPQTGQLTIELDGREMNYYATDCWNDHEGFETSRLISLVKFIMSRQTKDKVIGVHCRAGVGRTGTFIAAYALIQEIDEQIAQGMRIDDLQISIDKVVWELSLQRPFMIAHFPQYKALHQLVSAYTESLKTQKH